jgi:segregation and condensation protein A
MFARAPYQLTLPGFEGPLDLLLQVIERKGLEIAEISLVLLVEQCLAQLRGGEGPVDAAGLADFVAIGARLLLLKSRSLLPRPLPPEAPEPDADDLAATLREYRRYREGATVLRFRLVDGERYFPRLAPPPIIELKPSPQSVAPERLALLLHEALVRAVPEPPAGLPPQLVTVREKTEELLAAVHASARVSFLDLVARCASRLEVAVCFIALLHLLRDGAIDAVQPEPFGDILLARRG